MSMFPEDREDWEIFAIFLVAAGMACGILVAWLMGPYSPVH